ncbi:unnamed protein product [Effrenium voratum]|nr:unnamed protein product [Effrenium voratum]
MQVALHREASKAAAKMADTASQATVSEQRHEKENARERWILAAKEVLLPATLQAPLALLSPWSSLAGVATAAMPGLPPPPTAMLPPGLQEEEPFAALIFPGFDSGAFIWQITCWQASFFERKLLTSYRGRMKAFT